MIVHVSNIWPKWKDSAVRKAGNWFHVSAILTSLKKKAFENFVEKEENFLLSPLCFLPFPIQILIF